MKPLPTIYRFVIGFLLALFIAAVLIIAIDRRSSDTTQQDVAIKHVIDSIETAHNAETIAREDSIQRQAYNNIALLQTEKDKAERKAYNSEQKLKEQSRTIADLEAQYADKCSELITSYRERHDTALSIIAQKKYELVICNAENNQYQNIVNSQETEIAALTKTVNTKNETIATQKDYITGVTNRSDRSWLFRNWRWMWGNWREYVLQK